MPTIAAGTYVAAWAAGLAVWPVNLPINAAGAQVAASYQAHPAQYLLAEGLAGLLLGVVLAFAIFSRHRGQIVGRTSGAAAFGAVAVAISVTQCVIGLFLTAAATRQDVALCGDLSDLVNRLDGVKMLALAGAAGWLAAIRYPRVALPPVAASDGHAARRGYHGVGLCIPDAIQ
jgi:hypothetical protein